VPWCGDGFFWGKICTGNHGFYMFLPLNMGHVGFSEVEVKFIQGYPACI
jgi:hypothetical protein